MRLKRKAQAEDQRPASRSLENQPARVLLADSHQIILDALTRTITRDPALDLVGAVLEPADLPPAVDEAQPEVVVLELAFQEAFGLDLMRAVHAEHPDLLIVVYSMYNEFVFARRALRAGASAYVMKAEPTQVVADAIHRVLEGEVYLSSTITGHLLNRLADWTPKGDASGLEALTDREVTVCHLLGQGYSVGQIAERYKLSRKTVETHRRRAMGKLGLRSKEELLQYIGRWTNV